MNDQCVLDPKNILKDNNRDSIVEGTSEMFH